VEKNYRFTKGTVRRRFRLKV